MKKLITAAVAAAALCVTAFADESEPKPAEPEDKHYVEQAVLSAELPENKERPRENSVFAADGILYTEANSENNSTAGVETVAIIVGVAALAGAGVVISRKRT